MVSDFRKKKYLHVFSSFFDFNGSGSIDKKDFDLAVDRIAKFRGWKAGDATYTVLQDTINDIWTGLQSRADADNDGQVSQDEWIATWDAYAKNPSSAADWQTLYCKFIFQLEDASNDGSIDSNEFAAVYESFGLDKSEAVNAFQKMSKGKATVTWAEFQKLWVEYFSTDDVNAPGNFIFGKTSF